MSFSPSTFRQLYSPTFSDPGIYSDARLNSWAEVAGNFVDIDRWGKLADHGINLVVAHHLVLAAQDNATSEAGGIAGHAKGPVTAKSVDKVSVSYDAGSVTHEGGDFWNLSRYGIEYLRIAKMMGAGGIQF